MWGVVLNRNPVSSHIIASRDRVVKLPTFEVRQSPKFIMAVIRVPYKRSCSFGMRVHLFSH
jgi:hypothetical protein